MEEVKKSSSGLHHDFHDNLYILLRGKKTFKLYSPSDALKMSTYGKIIRVHETGRINYEGFPTMPDGATAEDHRTCDAEIHQEKAAEELELAEAAVEKGEPNAQERLQRAESAFEACMENMMDNFEDDYSDDDGDEGDDMEPSAKRTKLDSGDFDVEFPSNFCKEDAPCSAAQITCDMKAGIFYSYQRVGFTKYSLSMMNPIAL